MNPGSVLLRKYVRNSKNDPYVEEVELIESNPQYAHIRYADGRESTVSVQDLAPRGSKLPESEPTAELHQHETPIQPNITETAVPTESASTQEDDTSLAPPPNNLPPTAPSQPNNLPPTAPSQPQVSKSLADIQLFFW